MKTSLIIALSAALLLAAITTSSASTVEDKTWGTIKSLYRSSTPEAVDEEPLYKVGRYNSFPWNWNLPFRGCAWMTCGPGCYKHRGQDYWATDWSGGGARAGKPVLAPASGYVKFAGWSTSRNRGFGNQVIVEAGPTGQGNGNRYLYRVGHMVRVNVRAGWWVEKGQVLGWVGSTGYATGAHIHFSVHRGHYAGYGGISGESIPISQCWYDGIDGYNGSGYWCSDF